MAYAVFESTRMHSTARYGARIFDAVASTDIENGTFGYLDAVSTDFDGGVVRVFHAGCNAQLTEGMIVVADNPVWTENDAMLSNQRKDNYIIPAGTVFRARVVEVNDTFAVSIDGFTPDTQNLIGSIEDTHTTYFPVSIDETTGKLYMIDTVPSTETPIVMVGMIVRKRITGGTLVTATTNHDGSGRGMYEILVIGMGKDCASLLSF